MRERVVAQEAGLPEVALFQHLFHRQTG